MTYPPSFPILAPFSLFTRFSLLSLFSFHFYLSLFLFSSRNQRLRAVPITLKVETRRGMRLFYPFLPFSSSDSRISTSYRTATGSIYCQLWNVVGWQTEDCRKLGFVKVFERREFGYRLSSDLVRKADRRQSYRKQFTVRNVHL